MVSGLSRAGSALAPGDKVGDYIIKGPLASGGFGVIYRVTHAIKETPAALKVLHAELASTPGAVLRFEREIEVIQRLRHPNIVDIYSWGRIPDGRPYFVMELLPGVSLETSLQGQGRMLPDAVAIVLEALCTTLAVVHERGVIHRDLSPSNVFLAERGWAQHVVLLDFGVAKMLDAPLGSGLTTPSRPVGTPACMAPEQIRMQPATPRTDIYAVGVLTYAMLTGQLPFNDPSLMVMQSMHMYVTPAKPSALAPINPALDEVVLRAMSKQPERRYGSALELLEAFRAAQGSGDAQRLSDEGPRPAAALAITIEIDPEAAEDPDAALAADVDAIHILTSRALGERGLEVVMSAGNTMLFALYLPGDPEGERASRLACVNAALALRRELDGRPTRDPRARVSLCLHAGAARSPEETLADGDLWDVPSWAFGGPPDGVAATPEALSGLDVPARPWGKGGRLLCI